MSRDWKRYVTFKRVLVYVLVAVIVYVIAGCTLYGLGTDEQGGLRELGARADSLDVGAEKIRGYPSTSAVAVAQLVEPRVVVPVVGGSSPLRHPS